MCASSYAGVAAAQVCEVGWRNVSSCSPQARPVMVRPGTGSADADAMELGFNSKLRLFIEDAARLASEDASDASPTTDDSYMAPPHSEDQEWIQELSDTPLWWRIF